ncbi:flagellar hook-associated protein 2 [Paucidesulfovibrio gracilis DSM 16080]|uniref:Flagellar hook-associated protein 2 n=1 Tax=Paucidesulfovibrio gracilis DSM 16080 TaxID=1121449 RepID=A0A1T4WC61_9BACT|nr:flagellar filament capping protein FliD [Paucidesulfovibrio gracilis]SKA74892.1 flagellar hook-associated protein 2 [Paucidesulfovibrio gracilis DSM 16080]
MSDYTSGQINFAGLGNGTDFNQLIDGMIKIERNRVVRLESWKSEWEAKVEAFNELNTRMLSLKSTMEGMNTVNEFLTKSVTSTYSDVVSATADSSAEVASHTVRINQLAQNAILTNQNGYLATDAEVTASGAGATFEYSYQGVSHSLNVPGGTTLQGLQNLINNDPDNPGVKASLISDGSEVYLQFRGMDLGEDATLEIGAGTTLSGFTAADFDVTQSNQNAELRVNGWPTSDWISVPSNTVTGIVDGLTLNLKGSSLGTDISLTVNTDKEAVKENVRTFVDQINEVRKYILEITNFDTVEEEGSLLTGNYGVEMISQNLKNIASEKGLGFFYYDDSGAAPQGDVFSSLSQVGILTDADENSPTAGLLQVDEERLDEALAEDTDAVAKLFSADHEGGVYNTNDLAYYSHIDSITQAGSYKVKYTVDGSGEITEAWINGFKASIDNVNHRITSPSNKVAVGDTLVEQNPSAGLVLDVLNRAPGTYPPSGTSDEDYPLGVLKQGKTGQFINELKELTNENTGPLHILEENYEDIMDMIDDKIAYEEKRITKMERTLKEKFARLDALLGQYEGQSAQLTSQISQMSQG